MPVPGTIGLRAPGLDPDREVKREVRLTPPAPRESALSRRRTELNQSPGLGFGDMSGLERAAFIIEAVSSDNPARPFARRLSNRRANQQESRKQFIETISLAQIRAQQTLLQGHLIEEGPERDAYQEEQSILFGEMYGDFAREIYDEAWDGFATVLNHANPADAMAADPNVAAAAFSENPMADFFKATALDGHHKKNEEFFAAKDEAALPALRRKIDLLKDNLEANHKKEFERIMGGESPGVASKEEFAAINFLFGSDGLDDNEMGIAARNANKVGLAKAPLVEFSRKEQIKVAAKGPEATKGEGVAMIIPGEGNKPFLAVEGTDGIFRRPDGSSVPDGAIPFKQSVQATSIDTITSGLSGKAARDKSLRAASSAGERIVTLTSLNDDLQKMGSGGLTGQGAIGFTGSLAEEIGGRLAQINRSWGNNFSEMISGATLGEVASFRLQSQMMIAQSVSIVAGEQSGRITKEERELTALATALAENAKDFSQLDASLQTLMRFSVVAQAARLWEAGRPAFENLETPAGRRALSTRFFAMGMTPDTGQKALKSLLALQREQKVMERDSEGPTNEPVQSPVQ